MDPHTQAVEDNLVEAVEAWIDAGEAWSCESIDLLDAIRLVLSEYREDREMMESTIDNQAAELALVTAGLSRPS